MGPTTRMATRSGSAMPARRGIRSASTRNSEVTRVKLSTKATRVAQFHKSTLHALQELVQSAGLHHPSELDAHHIVRRVSDNEVRQLSHLLLQVRPGAILDDLEHQHNVFRTYWPLAQAESFQALTKPVIQPSAPQDQQPMVPNSTHTAPVQ